MPADCTFLPILKKAEIVERKENINRAIITLAIALSTTVIVRSYLSIVSLYHALTLVSITSGSTTRDVYPNRIDSVKKLLVLTVATLMIIPAFALTTHAWTANPNARARYDNVKITGQPGGQAASYALEADQLSKDELLPVFYYSKHISG